MYSEYYEKEMNIEGLEDVLLDIYEKVAEKENFLPDYEERGCVSLSENPDLLDTVLYHVETCGKDVEGYDKVRHLFEDTSGCGAS